MIQRWTEETFGLMGRTPDHVAGFFAGFAAKPTFFAAAGQHFADNLVAFYEYARDNHLYISYAIVPPQIDRSKPTHKQSDPTLCAGVVAERDGGIVLKGAQQLATGAVFSDYLALTYIHPLVPGDENYANSVVIPINAPGLRIYARRSYATTVTTPFDYPLSSRFDETDALITLDNVFVPWEHVFIYRDIALCRDQWTKTPAHHLHEKGGKEHKMPCHHALSEMLHAYVTAAGITDDRKGWLFRTSPGHNATVLTEQPLNQSAAWFMVRRRAAAAGIAAPIGNHTFRATGITNFLENGGTLEHAQDMAAHASPRTTRLYDRRKERITQAQVERIRL
jgi:aromatic ring hydroxylase